MPKTKLVLAGCIVYLISRLLFLTTAPVFFDSGEYLDRLQQSNYFLAVDSGHIPLHSGYLILFWPIYHLAQAIHLSPTWVALFFQMLLSLMALYLFFVIVEKTNGSKKIALMSVVLVSLLPLYWITNITLMIETTAVTFLLASTFAFLKLMNSKPHQQLKWACLGLLCFIFAFLTQPFVLLWLPFLWGVIFFRKDRFNLMKTGLAQACLLTFGLVIGSLLIIFLIAQEIHAPLNVGFYYLFGSKLGEQASFSFTLKTGLIYFRNFLLPLIRNNTLVLTILGLFGVGQLIRQKKWLGWWWLLCIAPAFMTNQWWDSLFAGRHALIASFALSFGSATVLSRHKVWFSLVCIYLLIVSLHALMLLRILAPYLQEASAISELPAGGMIIESHYARPQTQGKYNGRMVFVDEPTQPLANLDQEIRSLLSANQPVFVSGAALSEPYGFYTGPYLHTLSLSYREPFHLKNILEKFTLEPYKIVDASNNVTIYKITSGQPHPYPLVPILRFSAHRLDAGDPTTQVWLKFYSR